CSSDLVTNQKTKSIRPASRDAGSGSHAGTSASVSPAPPATIANRRSWTREPLRTLPANVLHSDEGRRREPESGARTFLPCNPPAIGRRNKEEQWVLELESSSSRSARS